MSLLVPQDQFHRMVELTMAARQAYKMMLENARQELAGEPEPLTPGSPPPPPPLQGAPVPTAGTDEPHYSECCWGRGGARDDGAVRPPRGRACY